jgi:plasmid stabilization system protein ParE
MVRIDWARPAKADLRELARYIEQDSRRYAQITVEKIHDAVSRLIDFPGIGHVLPEFPDEPYLQILMGPYRIVYREDANLNRVLIMAVIHAARDFAPLMEGRIARLG